MQMVVMCMNLPGFVWKLQHEAVFFCIGLLIFSLLSGSMDHLRYAFGYDMPYNKAD